jgi:hypothetical protein
MRFAALVIWVCWLVPSAASGLNFSVGDVSVSDLTAFGFLNTPAGNEGLSFDGGVTDELYEHFGYLGNRNGLVRIDDSNFSVVSGLTQAGNSASASLALNATGAAALGLSANDILIDHTFTLIDDVTASDADEFRSDITLTNDSGARQALRYYSYLDLDLAGTFANDSATGDQSGIFITDGSSGSSWLIAGGSDRYEVAAYATLRDKLDGWRRSRILANSGTPFGPGDFTAAQQINFNNFADQGSVS